MTAKRIQLKKKSKSGMTIVEVLVAITLLGILAVAFLTLFSSALSMTIRSGKIDKSVAGLAGKVEENLANTTDASADPTIGTTTGETVQITYGDGTSGSVSVKKNVMTTIDENGREVIIIYYTVDGGTL